MILHYNIHAKLNYASLTCEHVETIIIFVFLEHSVSNNL